MSDPFQPFASLVNGRQAGASRGARGRHHSASPFAPAAKGSIYSMSRPFLTSTNGRGGGEVFPRRSSGFGGFVGWPLQPAVPADEKNDANTTERPLKLSAVLPLSIPCAPLSEADHNANDGGGSAVVASGSKSKSATGGAKRDDGTTAPATTEAAVAVTATTTPGKYTTRSRRRRRRVSWSGVIETREVERAPRPDVFSPDLHALVIARQLAAAVDSPEIEQAVQDVLTARRQAAAVARSMSATDGWSGCLNGVVEETWLGWSAWNRKEGLYLRETDELVRGVVSRGGGGGGAEVYRLKAAYRAARRRMEDVDAE